MTTPQKIYLKDYKSPNFTINHVDLTIKLFDDHAVVNSKIAMYYHGQDDLVLFGLDLELVSIAINDQVLNEGQYIVDGESLSLSEQVLTNLTGVNQEFDLQITVKNLPQENRALEGLYIAGEGDDTMFVTQCEAEGFRKITYFADRPDVLTEYTTRLEADKKFTTLLANGHLVEKGELADDRHFAVWHDPTKKPSYLFACVFANLSVLSDTFTTSEGREVALEIYTKEQDIEKCHVAMQALKDSMRWDEEHYGCCYDLDCYMIVAVSQFNMGAMENKGLNIFNTACVLSSPETTTDARSFSVKAIIAHEYFHNWTGNRITCRDWFQLCLKEGFTVYRDQSFSACQQSPAVQRIDDVGLLRAHQFAEDAGSLAHPVRPESFIEINNFYTTTVYEKGAEIVRMLANMMGAAKFRQGTDEYFKRYDGQAVTVEDFLDALNSADNRVNSFMPWYRQPGTPTLSCESEFDIQNKTLTIKLSQKTRQVSGYDKPVALPIPVACAVFDKQTGAVISEDVFLLEEDSATYTITDLEVNETPILSVLRDFSAPVILDMSYTETDLAFLIAHETNGFNRWQATQSLVNKALSDESITTTYLESLDKAVTGLYQNDPMLTARLFDVPSEKEMATNIHKDYDPKSIQAQRKKVTEKLSSALTDTYAKVYKDLPITQYADTSESRGERALRNVCLNALLAVNFEEVQDWAADQYKISTCMTERLGALQAMVNHKHPQAQYYLDDFFNRFSNEELVIDLWFTVQSGADSADLEVITALIQHDRFDWNTPNRVRSVLGQLANRPVDFWSKEGLQIYVDAITKLDSMNPVFAARLTQPLAKWSALVPELRDVAYATISELRKRVSSKNVIESLDSILSER